MNGRAAAPPAMACSVGPSTSTNPRPASVLRIDCTIFVRRKKRLQHAVGVDQIEIPHPLPQLGIGQALVLLRRRGDRLGEELQVLGEDRQLARLGPLQLAVDADDVAQVEALGQGEVLVAHLALADHHLDRAGPVADLEPMDLARGTAQHDSPGRADLRAMLFGRLAGLAVAGRLDGDFAFPGADFADRLMVVEPGAPGIDAQFAYFAQFLASGGFEGRFAAGRLLRSRFVHAQIQRRKGQSVQRMGSAAL